MQYPFDCISDFIFVQDNITPSDIILIPGGSHPQLMERAAELYRQGMASHIIPSGNKNMKLPDFPTEADYLKSIALGIGVPDDIVICERKATNTWENAVFSFDLLNCLQIKHDTVILVCKAYHARRALFTYQKAFPKDTQFLVSSVIDNRGISKENWYKDESYITVVMGEVEKIGKYFSESVYSMYTRAT